MSLTLMLPSWELALDSGNKSPKTIKSYLASVRSLTAFLAANDMPGEIDDVTTESIRAFLVAERERTTRGTPRGPTRDRAGQHAPSAPASQVRRRTPSGTSDHQ
jgi:hypothetical protein